MDPFTLIALATAAGFVFNKISGQSKKEERREFTYSKDLVARLKPDNKSEIDLASVDVLPEYRLIKTLVANRFPIVFVTGGAGTGKSTFVRWALNEFAGSVLLGGPTAMSAINIGGKTLHSLCQLPPGWISKNDIKKAPHRKEIQEAKLLIIDEMSMVTANLLDGVSGFLRLNRKIDKPFGGLPVILVGDMFQLPPVVSEAFRPMYEQVYGSAKFYNAKCLQESTYYAVELNKTYRQSDQHFVDMLTRLREGVDLRQTIDAFNAACTLAARPEEGAVWLSPRNTEVDDRNRLEQNQLPGAPKTYRGKINGRFQPDRLPSPRELTLKFGTQVMFTRNDSAGRWINGSVGRVQRMLDDKIFVELSDSSRLVDVGRVTWKDYQYGWNRRRGAIERTEIGSYSQFPVIPAWAITIHKSQGKTIEKVHLDLGKGAFETGQTYVALSRCRSLQGLSMTRPLQLEDILVDYESKEFYVHLRNIISRLPPQEMLEKLQTLSDL
jgi:ATP-dependent exoDNAse (exonuclease V) alpha subunit